MSPEELAERCSHLVAEQRSAFHDAKIAYDEIFDRYEEDLKNDVSGYSEAFMWAEIVLTLAKMGWALQEFEDYRWPIHPIKV